MTTTSKSPVRSLWLCYLACDIVAVVAAYGATVYLRFFSDWGEGLYGFMTRLLGVREPAVLGAELQLFYTESAFRIIVILSVTLCFLYGFFELYAGRRFLLRRPVILSIIAANVLALGLFYCYFYVRVNVFHPRTVFVTIAFLNIIFCGIFRAWLDRILKFVRARSGFDECRTVLVGSDELTKLLDEFISEAEPQGVRIVGRVPVDRGGTDDELIARVRECVLQGGAHMIVCSDRTLSVAAIMRIIQESEELRVTVKVHSKEMDVLPARARVATDVIRDTPLVHFSLPSDSAAHLWLRGMVSRVLSSIMLVVLFPFLLLVALLVKATSAGPVLFVQERIGVNRIPFRMYKFRTMHRLADDLQAQVEEFNESGTGLFKMRRDPRVTFLGRFLRRFSIDELPQLVNVIRGDMALVGPRPLPRRDFEHYYENWHYIRHGGLPGLTCLWQISGRSDLDFHNMCILDVYYLRNRSFMLDLKILLKTTVVVLFAKGAY